jgi:hypothetical protein
LCLGVAWLHFIDAAAIHPQRNASPIEHTLQFLPAVAAGPVFAELERGVAHTAPCFLALDGV